MAAPTPEVLAEDLAALVDRLGLQVVGADEQIQTLLNRDPPNAHPSTTRTQRTNPSPRVVVGLAEFFGVEPAYFYSATAGLPAIQDLALLSWLRGEPLRTLLVHAHHVPADSLDLLVRFAEMLRAAEGLAPDHDYLRPPSPTL